MSSPRRTTHIVLIDGVEVPNRSGRTVHDVDQPVGTGSLVIPGRRPAPVDIGAPVTIYAGYDGATATIFNGQVATYRGTFGEGGAETRVVLAGNSRALWFENDEEVGFPGPLTFNSWFHSLCHWRGIPLHASDAVTDIDGISIMVGNNPDINGGWIPIETKRSPGSDIEHRARNYGYRVFEVPDGTLWLTRISGIPPAGVSEASVLFAEGDNVLSIENPTETDGLANYWDVRGAKYQAADTSEVAIRSFTGTVVANPTLFGPNGVSRRRIGPDETLDTQHTADATRWAHEMDYSDISFQWRWETVGDPWRRPGEQIALLSPSVGPMVTIAGIEIPIPVPAWLTRVEQVWDTGGWTTRMESWTGTGEALPGGNDCAIEPLLGSAGVHVGNEYLTHYRNKSPNGNHGSLEHHIDFTVADTYSTLTIRGFAHGTNSFVRNQESTASRFEIWQGGERVASGELPRQNENLERRYPYSQDQYWDPIVVPLTGRLAAGPAQFRIISGRDSQVGDHDDFEVRDLILVACGVGEPVIIAA